MGNAVPCLLVPQLIFPASIITEWNLTCHPPAACFRIFRIFFVWMKLFWMHKFVQIQGLTHVKDIIWRISCPGQRQCCPQRTGLFCFFTLPLGLRAGLGLERDQNSKAEKTYFQPFRWMGVQGCWKSPLSLQSTRFCPEMSFFRPFSPAGSYWMH